MNLQVSIQLQSSKNSNKKTNKKFIEKRWFKNSNLSLETETFSGSVEGFVNGKGSQTKMNSPFGLWWNSAQDCLYFCDISNNAIRKINLQGISSPFADFLLIFILL